MKRILIIVPYFGLGGTISSLCAFLENVDPSIWKVDIFARKRTGVYIDKLPNCRILPENVYLSSKLFNANIVKKIFCRGLHYMNYALSKAGWSIYPITCKIGGRQIDTEAYDAVISYQESLSQFLSYLPSKKRIPIHYHLVSW